MTAGMPNVIETEDEKRVREKEKCMRRSSEAVPQLAHEPLAPYKALSVRPYGTAQGYPRDPHARTKHKCEYGALQ